MTYFCSFLFNLGLRNKISLILALAAFSTGLDSVNILTCLRKPLLTWSKMSTLAPLRRVLMSKFPLVMLTIIVYLDWKIPHAKVALLLVRFVDVNLIKKYLCFFLFFYAVKMHSGWGNKSWFVRLRDFLLCLILYAVEMHSEWWIRWWFGRLREFYID